MQISSSTPAMTGSIEDMIAKLSVELEDQASEQRKAGRAAEDARHEAALQAIDEQRDASWTAMGAGLVSSGASIVSVGVGGNAGEAIGALGKAGSSVINRIKVDQELDAAQMNEQAKVLESARNQNDDGAQSASRYADKALSHMNDIQRLIHESRMSSIRG